MWEEFKKRNLYKQFLFYVDALTKSNLFRSHKYEFFCLLLIC